MRRQPRLAGPRRGGGLEPRSPRAEGGSLKLLRSNRFLVPVAVSLIAILSVGCAGANHLAEYDFTDHGLAVVTVAPHRPELFLGGVEARSGNPLAPAINRSSAARQSAAGRARSRLDSAASYVSISNLVDDQLLEHASRALGAHAVRVRGRADYVLFLHIRRLAIDAHEGGQAWLGLGVTASLFDRTTEREIWRAKVTARDPLTAGVRHDGRGQNAALTAGTLYGLSAAEFGGVLEDVAVLTAQAVLGRLRSDLREARQERRSPEG